MGILCGEMLSNENELVFCLIVHRIAELLGLEVKRKWNWNRIERIYKSIGI